MCPNLIGGGEWDYMTNLRRLNVLEIPIITYRFSTFVRIVCSYGPIEIVAKISVAK